MFVCFALQLVHARSFHEKLSRSVERPNKAKQSRASERVERPVSKMDERLNGLLAAVVVVVLSPLASDC